jgi:glucuronyl/N-acetylglucosaminyl transferase EXT2
MPFSEVLDWKRAAIFINEHRLDETLKILQEAYDDGNFYKQLQEQGRFFYDNYFSSMTKITWTTLDILNDRILPYRAKPYEHWNRPLVPSMPQSPFFVPLIPSQKQGFTAIVLTYDRFELMKRVVNNIAWSKHVAKIIIIWNNPELDPPPDNQWPVLSVPIKVIQKITDIFLFWSFRHSQNCSFRRLWSEILIGTDITTLNFGSAMMTDLQSTVHC